MLKYCATGGYYVDGKGCIAPSANARFFGVNIDPQLCTMILSFIISTSLFFLFLLMVSVRSIRQTLRPAGRLLFAGSAGMAAEGSEASGETAVTIRDGRADAAGGNVPEADHEEEYRENIYKGILWMKEKYEQYRDLADERYERLKEQMLNLQKKYEDREPAQPQPVAVAHEPEALAPPAPETGPSGKMTEPASGHDIQARLQELEEQFARERQRLGEEIAWLRHQLEEEVSRSRRQLEEQAADARGQLEQHMQHSSRQLEEKQRIIAEQEGQLRSNRQKIEELVAKLRHNGQLLLNIYKELDKSFQPGEES